MCRINIVEYLGVERAGQRGETVIRTQTHLIDLSTSNIGVCATKMVVSDDTDMQKHVLRTSNLVPRARDDRPAREHRWHPPRGGCCAGPRFPTFRVMFVRYAGQG